LRETAQTIGDFPTQCSFLFDPIELEIYVMIKHDYTKILRVDLQDETMETFSGFDFDKTISLGANGIAVSNLVNWSSGDEAGITVYPNPADSEVYVSGLFDQAARFRLLSLNGGIVKQGQLQASKFSVSDLDGGVYILQLETDWEIIKEKIVVM